MRVQYTKEGFITYVENEVVEKIDCKHEESLTVYYHTGETVTVNVKCDVYHAQFGIPVSKDGMVLYVMDWYKGVVAYSVQTGEVLWKHKSTRITKIIAYDTYIAACRYEYGLVKLDAQTGELLTFMKSGIVDKLFELTEPYVLTNYRGKPSIIDTETMTVIRQYSPKEGNPFNPYNCMYQEFHRCELNGNKLTIYGYEKHPGANYPGDRILACTEGIDIYRTVELDFL